MVKLSNEELDDYFAINQESYKEEFVEIYKKFNLEPKYLIQFPVILPFNIPFSQGVCISFVLDNNDVCTLHFSIIESQKSINAGIVTPEPISTPVHKTRVEMTYVSSEEVESSPDSEFLTNIFEQMVFCLNYVITGYLVHIKDTDVYTVSRKMFEFESIYRIIPTDNWEEMVVGIFLLNNNIPYKKNILGEEETDEVINQSVLLYAEKNPFILSEKYMLKSKRNFENGFYEEAVINCQISIETFLSALISNLLEQENKSESEIDKFIEDISFIKMVKSEFHPRLGGNWDPTDSSKKIGKWYSNTYDLRNSIVHTGYTPTSNEAQKSLESAINFRAYIIKLVNDSENKYSKAKKYFQLIE